jgi:hypothetical protein
LYSSSNLSVFHIYLSAQQDLRRGTPRASIAPSGWLVEVQIGYNVVDVLVEPADGCSVAGCFTIPADCIIYSLTSMNNEVPPKLIFLI